MARRIMRARATEFLTREEDDTPHISGYFAVFGEEYQIAPGMSESIDRHAFDSTLSGDIRALVNHDTTLVLGRTKAGTLALRVDERGLWGDVDINPADVDAMNLYERVKRGDVDQCSFGFEILREDQELRDGGAVHWTIREVELYEVSACTFPAYETTNISARFADRDRLLQRERDAWKIRMKGLLKNGTESTAAAQEDRR